MLTLLLLRHAKAGPPAPGLEDFDRTLKDKGRTAAQAIGRYMAANRLAPVKVLCSPAARTRETWDIVAREFNKPPSPAFRNALYESGDGQKLFKMLTREPGSDSPLLLVGHNPSTEELALRLAAPGGELRRQIERKYPTAGLAVLRFGMAEWPDLAAGGGELLAFVRPAQLIGGHDD